MLTQPMIDRESITGIYISYMSNAIYIFYLSAKPVFILK